MKEFLAVTLIGLLSSLVRSQQDQICDSELSHPIQTKQFAEGNTQFALNMYKAMSEQNGGNNIFISPFSISAAFGMLNAGARTETEREIRQALKLNPNADDVNLAFADIMRSLNPATPSCTPNFTLSTANRLFVQKSFDILTSYQNTLEQNYGTGVSQEDFASNSEGARNRINNWVAQVTNDKIRDLLPATTIGPATVMVLVNAIYFKGNWQEQFQPILTKPMKFQQDLNSEVEVDFMSKKNKRFPFANSELLDCKLLQMPYVGDRLSMVILLPNKVDGLADLENRLTAANLRALISSAKMTEVDVKIPKFKLTIGQSLVQLMQSLGVRLVFGNADLSGITENGGLAVSEAIHKAFVDVNEEGTEAAAATGIVVTRLASHLPPLSEQFIADHPFIFMIYDKTTELVLFLGRLVKPPPKGGAP